MAHTLTVNGRTHSVDVDADKYLDKLESHQFISSAYRCTDSIIGALPNIPAYLSGNPCNMRLRRRVTLDSAPLAIVVDLTSSAAIKNKDLERRGAAILALVRILSQRRPIELWAGTGLNRGDGATLAYFKIDTAPLDLARAAYALIDPAVSRGLGYGVCYTHGYDCGGSWPFQNHAKWRDHGHKILREIIPHNSEVLFLAPLLNSDDSISNPAKWLSDMIARFGGDTVERD